MKNTKNIALIRTYYLNCRNNEKATQQNDTIRFDSVTMWPHCTFMSALCYSFWKAQLLQQEGLKEPRKLCILVDEDILHGKAKPENESTSYEQLDWFLNNIEPPMYGMIVSVYSHKVIKTIEDRWSAQTIWPLKKEWQWEGGGGYFTLQDTEDNVSRGKEWSREFHITKKIIDNIYEHSVLPVVKIDYKMSEEKLFKTLKYSNLNFSYTGGTYYTAGMIGCPTVGLYDSNNIRKVPTSYYLTEDLDSIKDEMVDYTWWNLGVMNVEGKVLQYDFNTVYQRPQTYLKHVTQVSELLSYLKCQSDFLVNGKRYELS